MLQHPSLIKRPVLAAGKRLLVGFSQNDWECLL
jgi:arsenate reductase-like glutaredoxin family protein